MPGAACSGAADSNSDDQERMPEKQSIQGALSEAMLSKRPRWVRHSGSLMPSSTLLREGDLLVAPCVDRTARVFVRVAASPRSADDAGSAAPSARDCREQGLRLVVMHVRVDRPSYAPVSLWA